MILLNFNCSAQKMYLKINGNSIIENKTIDSIGYNTNHINIKSVFDEANFMSEKLLKLGFIENEVIENKKTNDTTFRFVFDIRKKTNFIHIYIGANSELKTLGILKNKNDTLKIAFSEIENFMQQNLKLLEQKGFSLSSLKLINYRKTNHILFADLDLQVGNKRQLNDIVIVGYEKFPEGHKKNIKRLYKNKVFNLENLKKLKDDFDKFRFISQKKYPEILFTKDTTKVYVYLEKTKPNRFDGLVGFSNDEKRKIKFNGYLDLLLINTLNSGEEFTLFWKSDGADQKTFNAGLELPYIFKTRFGLKTTLNIFKQDSTFQNTKTNLDIGYFFNYNSRLYLGYQSAESSDIQNVNKLSLSDFKNTFTTLSFEFLNFKNEDFLFPEKTKINLKTGFGSRTSTFNDDKQIYFEVNLKHNLYLNEKNSFNLKSQNYYLKSGAYLINELYRFGGINSIRGFNENSLQANVFTSILTEYRYLLTPTIYFHTITDYGFYKDSTINKNSTLLGIGFGFGLLTKNGLLNLVYANGSTKDQAIKTANSIVHIKFVTNF